MKTPNPSSRLLTSMVFVVAITRFTYDDGHVISTGGNDSCILVWKTDCIEEAREVDLAQERDEEWTLDERPPLIAKEEGVEAESHSPSHHDNDTIDDVPLPLVSRRFKECPCCRCTFIKRMAWRPYL